MNNLLSIMANASFSNLWWIIPCAVAIIAIIIIIVLLVIKHRKESGSSAEDILDEDDDYDDVRRDVKPKAEKSSRGEYITDVSTKNEKTENAVESEETKTETVAVKKESETKSPKTNEPTAAKSKEPTKTEKTNAVTGTEAVIAPMAEEKSAENEKKSVEAKQHTATVNASANKRLMGKWYIIHKGDGEYISNLRASNGEVMLTSEPYSSADGAVQGIATIIKGVESGNFIIYRDKANNYYYKLKTANNRLLCVGEIYRAKEQCLKAVDSVKRIAKLSPISEEVVETESYIPYKPSNISKEDFKKNLKGKWKVEKTDEGKFTAKLYASNGQLMLATEEVVSKQTAESGIDMVKKNAEQGNFIIDRDKFGRYYYKLRNQQKSVICIGEAYESLDSCISAIESVRRFALNSVRADEIKPIVQDKDAKDTKNN